MKMRSVRRLLTAAAACYVLACSVNSGSLSFKFDKPIRTESAKEAVSDVLSETEKSDIKTSSGKRSIQDILKDSGEKIAKENNAEFIEASLVRVVDGDTLVVHYDNEDYKVRLIGINTPESVASKEYLDRTGKENTEEGVKASDITKELLSGVDTVYLEKDVSDTDRYGRKLYYVWLTVPSEVTTQSIAENMLNGMLLTSGAEKAAEPATYEPDTKYEDEFLDIYENY